MGDEFLEAAKNLPDVYRDEALRHLEETSGNDVWAGIIRQHLAGEKPLSAKQQWVMDNEILPSTVERCGFGGCKNFTRAGHGYCVGHELKYGDAR